MINFLEVENQQLETEKAISEVRAIRARKEVGKAKAKLDEALGTLDDSENEDEERIINMFLKSKDAQIRELQTNLSRAKNVINFLDVENQ